MFGNVKNKMSSWIELGSQGKTDQDDSNTVSQQQKKQPIEHEDVHQTYSKDKLLQEVTEESSKDDSSAIGSGDGDVTMGETQTEGKEENLPPYDFVSTKAFEGARLIGNFIFSAVNRAGKTVSQASAKIKKTVEENSLFGDFNKEQESFIKEKQAKTVDNALPPWAGCANEALVKEECLTISKDKRTFIRNPPSGFDFQFDYETSYPVAIAALVEDPNLEKMRFELVPKVISEENFWRNYFYRISLICQANELSAIVQEQDHNASKLSTVSVAESETKFQEHEVALPVIEQTFVDSPPHESVFDRFQSNSTDLEEVQHGIKKLSMNTDKKTEEEWEKELEAELQDYEVIADKNSQQDSNWENQIDEILVDEDLTELK